MKAKAPKRKKASPLEQFLQQEAKAGPAGPTPPRLRRRPAPAPPVAPVPRPGQKAGKRTVMLAGKGKRGGSA
ncbi:MAG TPA: hypothetical protein VD926_04050 [Acidimicrobiales bacterium]|nr:hypothetical protein [Acidimicrobiales bacterium]